MLGELLVSERLGVGRCEMRVAGRVQIGFGRRHAQTSVGVDVVCIARQVERSTILKFIDFIRVLGPLGPARCCLDTPRSQRLLCISLIRYAGELVAAAPLRGRRRRAMTPRCSHTC